MIRVTERRRVHHDGEDARRILTLVPPNCSCAIPDCTIVPESGRFPETLVHGDVGGVIFQLMSESGSHSRRFPDCGLLQQPHAYSRDTWQAWHHALQHESLTEPGLAYAQERGQTSYSPGDIKETFASIMARMKAAKPEIQQRHADLLSERYDLSNRPAPGVTMSREKPVQQGVRAKLAPGMTWEKLAAMGPEEIRHQILFPKGFYPLPHPNHPEAAVAYG
jgi:hypothetical protein